MNIQGATGPWVHKHRRAVNATPVRGTAQGMFGAVRGTRPPRDLDLRGRPVRSLHPAPAQAHGDTDQQYGGRHVGPHRDPHPGGGHARQGPT